MDIKILVATHKKYSMPKESMYLPIHVGCEGKKDLRYTGDNTGDNISFKNPNYCELTGLYWAWKNLKCDYIGLCHYRRYFTNSNLFEKASNKNNKMDLILSKLEIENLLRNCDVILPKKRNYYIETIWSHYGNAHHIKDLEETKQIISEIYPEYIASFDKVMKGKKLHLYNMFVMSKYNFDEYCKWLFNILFELERRIDISNYDSYQNRIFGFISERLFNVWLEAQDIKQKEMSVINMEKISWGSKILEFLRRKRRGK
ncbi:hypothetical protein VT91_22770 [Clostridium sporogenes]|uniref:DUF4422 domain-containing protein n=1 Tax=Clostridium botulinum TaxID=1491 RepID=UPI00071784CD|nr:DUF4422 domain-containing protein [Clostridium botulinum]KRU25375.1 hypothetical protein WG71_29520 [Clostridium sporogenes]KRU28619.1 hypothetical protein VT91_22770 [Clostridium sporogenes]KRU32744.1 hypothetical protein VT28_09110 [Clostridium sporogenes]KRU47517.1 hypothetical protein VT95_06330 [Clostridium sporogenes]MBZ1327877.1 DUF4422 domain-containing protein [Clostridium botulinum]